MKRITKRDIFVFLLGLILSGSVVYAATLIAGDITYDNTKTNINADNVQDAIDALYTKANSGIPESYTGSYTYTPSTNTQTIYSANKTLNDNITINPIPNSYKNLLSNTTATSSDILNGKTAYNNLGELITGDVSTDCVSNSHVWTQNDSVNGYVAANFKPKYFSVTTSVNTNGLGRFIWYYNNDIDSSVFYQFRMRDNNISTINLNSSTSFQIQDNQFLIKIGSDFSSGLLNIMACK